MGRDRTTSIKIGDFVISIDKDHLGYYKGKQAIKKGVYRGWHYHVDSEKYSQIEIMKIIENYLIENLKAEKYDCNELYIGVVERKPREVTCFRKDGKTCILWIGEFNGKLHVEANKKELYTFNLISKKDIINIFKIFMKNNQIINLNIYGKFEEHLEKLILKCPVCEHVFHVLFIKIVTCPRCGLFLNDENKIN